jgi:hypothetical protein
VLRQTLLVLVVSIVYVSVVTADLPLPDDLKYITPKVRFERHRQTQGLRVLRAVHRRRWQSKIQSPQRTGSQERGGI